MLWFTSFFNLLKSIFSVKRSEISIVSVPDTSPKNPIGETPSCETVTPTSSQNIPTVDVSPIPIDPNDEKIIIERLAKSYGFNSKTVRAIAKVESSGNPFRQYKGLGLFPVLRFEPHWFNKYEKKTPMPFTDNGKGFSSLVSETNHIAFQKAFAINPDAAIKATSFGKFQIMGFHFSKLGHKTPSEFLETMKKIDGQYDAFVKFVMTKQTLRNVIMKSNPTITDFKEFARSYNGSGNVDNYSKKMEKAYNSFA